jgi:hypothetical protein
MLQIHIQVPTTRNAEQNHNIRITEQYFRNMEKSPTVGNNSNRSVVVDKLMSKSDVGNA